MRLGGSKGLLALMSAEQGLLYSGKDIILRDSMIKSIPAAQSAEDPSLLTLDVLRCESLRLSTVLSSEAIIAMVHGGVPKGVFLEMGEQSLEDLRAAFLPYQVDGETAEDSMNRMVASCYRRGGVGMERKKRECVAGNRSTRIAGVVFDHLEEDEISHEVDSTISVDHSERYTLDSVTGQSNSLGER